MTARSSTAGPRARALGAARVLRARSRPLRRARGGRAAPLGAALGLAFAGLAHPGLVRAGTTPPRAAAQDAASASGPRRASPDIGAQFDEVDRALDALTGQLDFLLNVYTLAKPESRDARVKRRLLDGRGFFDSGDYLRAAIILFDVADTPGLDRAAGYPEAIYYLAESLFLTQNYLAARTYYQLLLDHPAGAASPFAQRSVLRLLQVAFEVDGHESVDRYHAILANTPRKDPSVEAQTEYVWGKSLYRRGRFDEAVQSFRAASPWSPFRVRSRYFAGATLVRQGRIDEALAEFEGTVREARERGLGAPAPAGAGRDGDAATDVAPSSGEGEPGAGAASGADASTLSPADAQAERRALDLAHLAIGRLQQERGNLSQAIAAYQAISRNSPYFDDFLYEVAWVFIKRGDTQDALRALDILELSTTDREFAPTARVLAGNLLLRQDRYADALVAFQAVLDQFAPIERSLESMTAEHRDPREHFREAARASGASFEVESFLPPAARPWAQEGEGLRETVQVVGGLRQSRGTAQDAERIISALERQAATDPATQMAAFPAFRDASTRASEVENELLTVASRLAEIERRVVETHAGDAERAQFAAASALRARVQVAFDSLPKKKTDIDARDERFAGDVRALEVEVSRVGLQLDGMREQVAAIKQWFNSTEAMRVTAAAEADALAQFTDSLREMEAAVLELEATHRTLQETLVEERQRQGGLPSAEDEIRARYQEALAGEQETIARLREHLDGSARAHLARAEGVRARIRQQRVRLRDFNERLQGSVAARMDRFRAAVDEERARLAGYVAEIERVAGGSHDLIGDAAYDAYRNARHRLERVLLHAEVGVIDVVWRRKTNESQKIQDLGEKLRRELEKVDAEFKGVLGGEVSE